MFFFKNDVVVYNNNKKENYKARNIVIATGSDVAFAGIIIDEKYNFLPLSLNKFQTNY